MVQEKKESLDERIKNVRSLLGEEAANRFRNEEIERLEYGVKYESKEDKAHRAKRWREISIYGVGGTLALGLLVRAYKQSVGILPGSVENDSIIIAALVGVGATIAYAGYKELKSYIKET